MNFYNVKYSVFKNICIISIDRQNKQNTFDDHVITELTQAFIQAQRNSNIKVVILKSEGDDFCSGYDVDYIKKIEKYDYNQNLQDSTDLMKLYLQIYTLRKPVIASVQGLAVSVGCGLISVCDYVISARETTMFGFNEIQYGFVPAVVLPFLVRRIGEGKAKELIINGNLINAEEALKIGLINKMVTSVELDDYTKNYVNELISSKSIIAIGLAKELMSRIKGMPISDALDYASNLNALCRMTDDCKRGIQVLLSEKNVEK